MVFLGKQARTRSVFSLCGGLVALCMLIAITAHATAQHETANAPCIFEGLKGKAIGVALDSENDRLIAGGAGGNVIVWNTSQGRVMNSREDRFVRYTGFAVSFRTRTLAIARTIQHPADRFDVLLLDLATMGVRATIDAQAIALIFSQDGRKLLIIGHDEMFVHDAATGKRMRRKDVKVGLASASEIAVHPDWTRAAVDLWRRDGGWAAVWNLETGAKIDRLDGRVARKYFPAYSPNGRALALGTLSVGDTAWPPEDSENGLLLNIYNESSHKNTIVLQKRPLDITSVAFSNDGARLAAAHLAGSVAIWNVERQERLGALSIPKDIRVTCLAFSPDGASLAAGACKHQDGVRANGRVLIWPVGRE